MGEEAGGSERVANVAQPLKNHHGGVFFAGGGNIIFCVILFLFNTNRAGRNRTACRPQQRTAVAAMPSKAGKRRRPLWKTSAIALVATLLSAAPYGCSSFHVHRRLEGHSWRYHHVGFIAVPPHVVQLQSPACAESSCAGARDATTCRISRRPQCTVRINDGLRRSRGGGVSCVPLRASVRDQDERGAGLPSPAPAGVSVDTAEVSQSTVAGIGAKTSGRAGGGSGDDPGVKSLVDLVELLETSDNPLWELIRFEVQYDSYTSSCTAVYNSPT